MYIYIYIEEEEKGKVEKYWAKTHVL